MPPDLRFDPLGRRHVLLAPDRARRGAPPFESYEPDPAPCDFCGGCEARTPPETYAIRHDGSAPNESGWSVRVVPNLYPATPVHEVVVHTPDHFAHYDAQDREARVDVLRAYCQRLRAADAAAAVFVWNRGRAAGASRTHPHGQFFGLEVVPPTLEREAAAFGEDPCVLCRMSEDPHLSIADIGVCRLVAHPAPLVADEVLLVPPCHPRLDDEAVDLGAVADALADLLSRTSAVYGEGLPFNLVFHTAPRDADKFHWHAHLMPRSAVWGGLEMGAELPIVAADPVGTADRLRGA